MLDPLHKSLADTIMAIMNTQPMAPVKLISPVITTHTATSAFPKGSTVEVSCEDKVEDKFISRSHEYVQREKYTSACAKSCSLGSCSLQPYTSEHKSVKLYADNPSCHSAATGERHVPSARVI